MGVVQSSKLRVLTGDTPTGKLHLGHWLGSLENRVNMQNDYDCYFIIANIHAFTTQAENPLQIRHNVENIILDYLAAGIDPSKSQIFVQSEVPAIAELTFIFSMLLPLSRIMRNPTIKSEIRDKGLGENYPFGFLLYPVGQIADILAFRPEYVPVGEDQLPHLEMTREVAKKFNQLYCGVDPHVKDDEYLEKGGLFPVIKPLLGKVKRLVGTGAPGKDGQLLKMSKSLNNAILLSDDADTVKKKVMGMYTDPNRLKASDPGTVENNPLWILHDAFNTDHNWLSEAKLRYQQGKIGDVECKKELVDVLDDFLNPLRNRRQQYSSDIDEVYRILSAGNQAANEIAEKTLIKTKELIKQNFGNREIKF